MVEEDCLVTLKQEPILDLTDDILLALCLLIFLSDGLVDVLLLGLVRIAGMHNRDLLVIDVVGHFQLLDDLLVLEVDLVHFGRHV